MGYKDRWVVTSYGPYIWFVFGRAKQSSLSRTMALIFGSCCPWDLKALPKGMGRSLKLENVAWGRHRVGFEINLNTLSEADKLRFILAILFLPVSISLSELSDVAHNEAQKPAKPRPATAGPSR